GLRLGGVNKIGKLHRILDEEDWNVVADDVPVALLRIELDRKAANVPRQIRRTLAAGHRRKADERGRSLARALENVRTRELGERLISLEESVRSIASRMDDPLRDAFVIEMEQFFAEMEVLQ